MSVCASWLKLWRWFNHSNCEGQGEQQTIEVQQLQAGCTKQ